MIPTFDPHSPAVLEILQSFRKRPLVEVNIIRTVGISRPFFSNWTFEIGHHCVCIFCCNLVLKHPGAENLKPLHLCHVRRHVVPLVDSIPLLFGYKQLTTKFHVYIFGIHHTIVAVGIFFSLQPMRSETGDTTFDW